VNLLLLRPEELGADGTARLAGRRLLHAREVLRLGPGDGLRVGILGGDVGTAEVLSLSGEELRLAVRLCEPPPVRPGVDLLLAMPRPKALRRILPAAAAFGVDRIVLVGASRVEKSFFDSPLLLPAAADELFCLGLEQARDTRPPTLEVRRLFRPFVEDELEGCFAGCASRLLAHPGARPLREVLGARRSRTLLAIGPDGGWVPFERELLAARGLLPASLGDRPLRTEVAVAALLGALVSLPVEPSQA
jgi:RsmE family RNA methyltransferase